MQHNNIHMGYHSPEIYSSNTTREWTLGGKSGTQQQHSTNRTHLPEELHRIVVRPVSLVLGMLFPKRNVELWLSRYSDLQLCSCEQPQNLSSRNVQVKIKVTNPTFPLYFLSVYSLSSTSLGRPRLQLVGLRALTMVRSRVLHWSKSQHSGSNIGAYLDGYDVRKPRRHGRSLLQQKGHQKQRTNK